MERLTQASTLFGAGLRTPPKVRRQVSKPLETFGHSLWLGPPLFAAVPETGHNTTRPVKSPIPNPNSPSSHAVRGSGYFTRP